MKYSVLAASFAAMVGFAVPALANPITITDVQMPYQETLTIGTPLSTPQGAYVGQDVFTTSTGQTLTAWCIDLFHDISNGSGQSLGYNVGPLTSYYTDPTTTQAFTDTQKAEIATLARAGDTYLAQGADPAHTYATLDEISAAIQLAIWHVEFGNLSFSVADTATLNLYGDYINMGINPAAGGLALISVDGHQDFVVDAPEPASIALLGVGLLGIGMARRRQMRA